MSNTYELALKIRDLKEQGFSTKQIMDRLKISRSYVCILYNALFCHSSVIEMWKQQNVPIQLLSKMPRISEDHQQQVIQRLKEGEPMKEILYLLRGVSAIKEKDLDYIQKYVKEKHNCDVLKVDPLLDGYSVTIKIRVPYQNSTS